MVTAILLLETAQAQTNAVAEALVELDGVSEVHSVAGRYDLVAILRVPSNDALAALVTEKIRLVEGIVRSETLIGFRVYSRHDLERMFGVGMGEW
jgi:DNA-binding Lrp family transcriptional regulator